MDENAEYCAIVAFTKDNDPTCEKNRQQLYALWTAYCIHHDLVIRRIRSYYRASVFRTLVRMADSPVQWLPRQIRGTHGTVSLMEV